MRQWLLQKITREQLGHFLDKHRTEAKTLEVGASSRPSLTQFPNQIASDISFHPQIDVQYDAHRMPFIDEQFDCVLAIEVLEHCHTPQQVIDECYRMLKPNGTLILTTRFIFPLHDAPHDYFRFTKYGLRHLCRAFSQVTIEEEAKTVTTMGVLYQRLAYQVDWKLPFTKIMLLLIAKILPHLQTTVAKEYGDIRKDVTEENIMASGYYLVARK
ncbi:MAG: class I SAM-dependent methyltransferase [Chloroflexota bacterium]